MDGLEFVGIGRLDKSEDTEECVLCYVRVVLEQFFVFDRVQACASRPTLIRSDG